MKLNLPRNEAEIKAKIAEAMAPLSPTQRSAVMKNLLAQYNEQLGDKIRARDDAKEYRLLPDYRQTFVVRHDWASAFNEEGLSDEFKLPYDLCAFEFRISGRTIIVLCAEIEDTRVSTPFIEANGYWYNPGFGANDMEFLMFAWKQIQAICIALDAEIATHSVVRAPHKLNEKRAKSGQPPLIDYHVVDLARRHRVANPSAHGTGSRKRLHWRRGHWRHFETSKTWVRWCLVGDPDLGFIQKHYSL